MGRVPETRSRRPVHHRQRIGQLDPRRALRRAGASRWSTTVGTFGGTCLNVGCIPTKMYVHPADLARTPEHAAPLGCRPHPRPGPLGDDPGPHLRSDRPDLGGRRALPGGEPEHQPVPAARAASSPTTRLRLDDGTEITADRFVLAAGSRVRIPDVEGLDDTPYETSDTVMRLPELPRTDDHRRSRLRRRGVRPRVLRVRDRGHRGRSQRPRCCDTRTPRSPSRFTRPLGERVDLRLQHELPARARRRRCAASCARRRAARTAPTTLTADVLLLATGRIPNGDRLDLDRTGVALDDDGYVVVDEFQRTTADPASSPSATSARTTSSSTWPTTRPGWSSTTCCTPTR